MHSHSLQGREQLHWIHFTPSPYYLTILQRITECRQLYVTLHTRTSTVYTFCLSTFHQISQKGSIHNFFLISKNTGDTIKQ